MSVKIVICTTSGRNESKGLAEELVKSKLAACVNIIDRVNSIYYWEGTIQNSWESMMIIKSEECAIDRLKEKILKLHSYSVPEIIVLDVTDGSSEYLKWVSQNVKC